MKVKHGLICEGCGEPVLIMEGQEFYLVNGTNGDPDAIIHYSRECLEKFCDAVKTSASPG